MSEEKSQNGQDSLPETEQQNKASESADKVDTKDKLEDQPTKESKHRRNLKEFLRSLSKKQWIIISIVVLVLIGGGVTSYYLWFRETPKPPVKQAIVIKKVVPKPVEPTTVASALTGLPVAPTVNQLPVTAVMIENSVFARPQSGLAEAGVVFEAIAEGGITRFVALYQNSTTPAYIGPVRSVRPYYLQWLMGFDAAVAHVGGSGEALQDITSWGVRDMNQFYNGSYFERITSRVAPHNVYTSMAQLSALEQKDGYDSSNFTSFPRKADQPSKDPAATTIDFNISGSAYNVQYLYDSTTNSYNRSEGGAPHMDVNQAGVQTQISPKVVIAMVMSYGLEADHIHSVYGTIGSGPAYVFQDGNVTIGTWHKSANNQQITFTNSSGATIKLDAGQTWITALGGTNLVSYSK